MKKNQTKYSRTEALKRIKANLNDGAMYQTHHFKKRLRERDISTLDISYVIRNGRIDDEPDLDITTNQWRYKINGKTIDGDSLSIIVELEIPKVNKLITCMKR